MNSSLIWMNGTIIPYSEAKIHVLTPAAKYGATIFEGLCGYWSIQQDEIYIFRLYEHLERLDESRRIMRIAPPTLGESFADIVLDTVHANGYAQDVHIRLSVWVDGDGAMDQNDPVGVMCAVIPRPERSLQSRASKAAISSWRRIDDMSMPPRVKCAANYNNGRLAQMQAKADGYDEALLLDSTGKVTEGTGACLFMIRNGVAVTPPATNGILESITRSTLLFLIKELEFPVEVRPIDRTELYVAQELFLCGSGYEITPIIEVDRHPVGSGEVGRMTRQLWAVYERIVRGETMAKEEWLTPIGSRNSRTEHREVRTTT